MSNFWPKIVSPGLGNWSVNVVRSTLALPTTAMRGRFAIFLSPRSRTASLVRGDGGVNRAGDDAGLYQHGHPRRRSATHRRKEMPQLSLVEFAIGPYAGAEIESERPDFLNCLGHIFRCEAAREKHWDIDTVSNCPAQRPVVALASTAQLLYCKLLISRVEQYCTH